MTDTAHKFIYRARELLLHNNFQCALNMYACAIYSEPLIKEQLSEEFIFILQKRIAELDSTNDQAEIFANFMKSIKMFPGDVDLLNDIGGYLYKNDYLLEALCHFEKALNIDNSVVIIEKNFNNAKCVLLPRNQFRALNDKVKNNAYRTAIRSSVIANLDSVLNIETGSGLLSLYANECNALAIVACESSKLMAPIAECVMKENNAKVIIVNKPAFCINHRDIHGTKSVLLTDTIDAGLFGEFILQSVRYAWENLLYPQNSKVIPGKAEYFIVGVNSSELNKEYKLCEDIKNMLNVSNVNVHKSTCRGETYDSEDLHLYEDVKYVSEPSLLFTIDFNDYHDVKQKLKKRERYNIDLTAIEDTEINMVIGWFNLYLTDNVILTTNPVSENRVSAWQQAVFFDVIPRTLRQNESMSLQFSTYGGKLATVTDTNLPISRISAEALTYLNDLEYMNMIHKSIGAVCIYLEQTVSIEQVDIVDLNPFPLFGVLMLRRGAKSLVCHANTHHDAEFLQEVLMFNGITSRKVTILKTDYKFEEVFQHRKFHVIFNSIIDCYGEIDTKLMHLAQDLKASCLVTGGVCLPSSVTVMGQLIYSEFLETYNRVKDDNVGYNIAKHLNHYQSSQIAELDIGRLEYESLSEVFEVVDCEDVVPDLIKVPILVDGLCNAIMCWYKIRLLDSGLDISTDRRVSFAKGFAFINSSVVKVFMDGEANVLRCVDPNGCYKLVLDVE